MPYTFRQEHATDADVLDPRWWNLNQSEMVGTFNGGLDRDNLPPNVITEAMLSAESMVNVLSSAVDGTWSPDMDIVTWQAFNAGSNGGAVTVSATVDCVLEIDWGGSWSWNGAWSQAASGATFTVDTVTCRVTVDGVVVAEGGPSEDMRDMDCVHLIGTVAVGPGTHEVVAEVMVTRLEYEGLDATGSCTNTITFDSASLVVVERRR